MVVAFLEYTQVFLPLNLHRLCRLHSTMEIERKTRLRRQLPQHHVLLSQKCLSTTYEVQKTLNATSVKSLSVFFNVNTSNCPLSGLVSGGTWLEVAALTLHLICLPAVILPRTF